MSKHLLIVAGLFLVTGLSGCAGALVGDTQSGTYQSPTTDRSHKQITEDGAISASIKSRYRNDNAINADDIQVSTYNNVVTLYGRVNDRRIIDRAIGIARAVNGVSRVVSRLSVGR